MDAPSVPCEMSLNMIVLDPRFWIASPVDEDDGSAAQSRDMGGEGGVDGGGEGKVTEEASFSCGAGWS